MSPEFSLINKYFNSHSTKAYKGIGDDAALIKKDNNYLWAISTDMLNEKIHFLPDTNPFNLGWKALAVNISDIYAMGGTPKFALLAIALPEIKSLWLKKFSDGLFSCAKKYNVDLIGGDTTKGPLSISICILGEVLKKNVLLRSNAKKNDDIWVTGELGLAALGLANLQKKIKLPQALTKKSIRALEKPILNDSIVISMAKLSHSAIDISDGFLADLGHILDASKVGADILLNDVPINPWIKQNKLFDMALTGGDDYQLLFTSPKKNRSKICLINKKSPIKLTRVGEINDRRYLKVINDNGMVYKVKKNGFDHFETK